MAMTRRFFEAGDKRCWQLNLASVAPGKDEFNEALRYFRTKTDKYAVVVNLQVRPSVDDLDKFDQVVVVTDVTLRTSEISCIDHPSVTIGWILRKVLHKHSVKMLARVIYDLIGEAGCISR